MNNILKTTARMGHFILRNKNNVLIGAGTIALAGVAIGVVKYLKTRRQVSTAPEEKKVSQRELYNPKNYGHKRDMYKSPAMASENLIKH